MSVIIVVVVVVVDVIIIKLAWLLLICRERVEVLFEISYAAHL